LKVFPQYFSEDFQAFYKNEKINKNFTLLLDLALKLNIFEQNMNVQAIFWYRLFNFLTSITDEIKINTVRRRIVANKDCQKDNPKSLILQNIFRNLEKSGVLVGKNKLKHSSSTFNSRYTVI
jgi:hypothetical protein